MSKKSKKSKERKKKRSTATAAKRRAETHKTGFDNTAFEMPDDKKQFALKSDKAVRLDIIPYEVGEGNPFADKGELHYERTFWVHRGIGVDGTSYVCLSKTCGEPCPICEFRAKLMKDPDADEDLIKDLSPKERQLFNVINTKEKNKGVQIWEISFHLFGKRLDTEIKNSDDDDNYENFAELEGGFTLKCGIDEKSFGGQSFYEVSSIGFKPRNEDYDDDILAEAACLDDLLIIKEYDELKEIFLQTIEEDDDDDKKSKKSSKKSKKASKKEDEDEDEDENRDNPDDPDFEKGDRVSAEIDGDTYEGVVKKVKDDEAVVLFDDGDEQTVDFDDLIKLDDSNSDTGEDSWEKGDRVLFEVDGEDYPGEITSVDDDEETATIEFDDGDVMEDIAFDDLQAEEVEEEEEEEEKKKSKSKGKDKDKKKDKKKGKGKCPGGGTFGKDTDELTECNDCPKWDECDDA